MKQRLLFNRKINLLQGAEQFGEFRSILQELRDAQNGLDAGAFALLWVCHY
ncbi:hypothetical protein [Leisingera sp. ANG-M1]|uniref:hypothetical protein n=1 Tax=Leisingera sp. ANG-M1 TaxID=1577895 RepID=UPI0019D34F97|nr:hypothetical protein [Leisingera sp. ANG-M1]